MWQKTYIECCTQMGQWKALEDHGRHVDDYDLLANAHCHLLNWRELRERILPIALVRHLLTFLYY